MELKTIRRGTRIRAELNGELDHHSAEYLREALDAIIADPAVQELELDMTGVGFMDSSGLGVILGRYRALTARGGRLMVTGVSAAIDRIFRMSGLYALVDRI